MTEKLVLGPVEMLHQQIDGAHFFTPLTEWAVGVCVASTNIKDAFDEVAEQLKTIAKLNHGIEQTFTPQTSLEEFMDWLDEIDSIKRKQDSRRRLGLSANARADWKMAEAV